MSKPYTKEDLSNLLDADLIWRRKELSDMKAAVRSVDEAGKPALLRALVTMSYAHWEGYVRTCASQYFQHLVLPRKPFSEFERQIYINNFLRRMDALHKSRHSLQDRCALVSDILDGTSKRFAYVHPSLIDTRSNLNTDAMVDLCTICGVDAKHFEEKRTFIDLKLLKRRNAIAHGQLEFIHIDEIDDLVSDVLGLMAAFRSLVENKVYTKAYAA